jgi:peptidoglycan/xylan/chitin deacetylase (PgdA/CDA1 family)
MAADPLHRLAHEAERLRARSAIEPTSAMRPCPPYLSALLRVLACASVVVAPSAGLAAPEAKTEGRPPQELHQRLDTSSPAHAQDVALTLDACGGVYDRDLIATLVRLQVPATVFVTRRWLDANPAAVRELLAHSTLFEIQNHGDAHVPAVVGSYVYGMPGARDAAAIEKEIEGGAQAIVRAIGRAPAWYRGAGAVYDAQGQRAIARLGYRIAGFTLNADDGATLGAAAVAQRLRQMRPGDIVIAHLNRPASGTAEGLAAALPELLARNLKFVTLSQAAGVQPAGRGERAR